MERELCFLTEQSPPWDGVLSDVLGQHNIPFLTRDALGAGMTSKVGIMLERVSFFVPQDRLEEARELVEDLFSGEASAEEEE